jgi:hypothetical protein
MAAIPRDFEMLGEFSVTGAPSSEISPESGGTAPVKTLINVDFHPMYELQGQPWLEGDSRTSS